MTDSTRDLGDLYLLMMVTTPDMSGMAPITRSRVSTVCLAQPRTLLVILRVREEVVTEVLMEVVMMEVVMEV